MNDDDSTFVFADFRTLLFRCDKWLLYKDIEQAYIKSCQQFESFTIYASPRIIARFPEDMEISASKHTVNDFQLPTAFSVSLVIGSWNQAQKIYQNIILHNIKNFLRLNGGCFTSVI